MVNGKKKASVAAVMAILAALGYGGYAIVKEGELENLRSGNVALFEVVRVIDGDTLELKDGDVVRLLGINAPDEGECYFNESKEALKKLVEGKAVELRKDVTGTDDFGRLLRYAILPNASGVKNDILVDEFMVREGYGTPTSHSRDKLYYPLLLEMKEQAARENKGMWGKCDYDPTGEHGQRDVAPAKAECAIKGNIATDRDAKIFLVPGCNNYAQVKIDPARGEKYFCSEAEAISAGFSKARYCP